jgi:D-beta-D-heptose 7-phosphate kinase/D-beta-D-heptose 1-phosphate adenosyltransferase
LLIGDSCIDEYQIGLVDRLSPEAPVPVVKIINSYSVDGMAANVKNNLSKFNVHVDFITNFEKITKVRYIDERSGQHLIRVDTEPDITSWSGRTPFDISMYDAIVISDYNKGFLTYDHIKFLIETANCPIFIDTKKTDLRHFSGNHVYVKINELENKNKTTASSNMIITLGSAGVMVETNNITEHYQGHRVDVVDVCGCGDTFLAAVAYWFLVTSDIREAVKFANKAASITVQHQGCYSPELNEILGN